MLHGEAVPTVGGTGQELGDFNLAEVLMEGLCDAFLLPRGNTMNLPLVQRFIDRCFGLQLTQFFAAERCETAAEAPE